MRHSRRNPGSSSVPNAPVELTPLLDIIFIFLFIVIIANVRLAGKVREEADEKTAQMQEELTASEEKLASIKEELAAAEEKLAAARSDLALADEAAFKTGKELEETRALLGAERERTFNERAAQSAYLHGVSEYERAGEYVRIVSVSCPYSENDAAKRQILIVAPGEEPEPILFETGAEGDAYAAAKSVIEEFIVENDDLPVVLTLNPEGILRRDSQALTAILNSLRGQYEYVY